MPSYESITERRTQIEVPCGAVWIFFLFELEGLVDTLLFPFGN